LTADDYFEIQNLLFAYPYALDRGDFDAVGRLFADAKVYSGGTVLADHDATALAEAFREWVIVYPDGTPRTRHMLANVIITPEGASQVKVSSYVIVFQQAPDRPLQAVIGGDYLDRLEKVGAAWRFVERQMGNDLIGDLSAHGRSTATIRPSRANK
jgi:3-phenylpropionate/cinnamic acid dioxygenase small subunit